MFLKILFTTKFIKILTRIPTKINFEVFKLESKWRFNKRGVVIDVKGRLQKVS